MCMREKETEKADSQTSRQKDRQIDRLPLALASPSTESYRA